MCDESPAPLQERGPQLSLVILVKRNVEPVVSFVSHSPAQRSSTVCERERWHGKTEASGEESEGFLCSPFLMHEERGNMSDISKE